MRQPGKAEDDWQEGSAQRQLFRLNQERSRKRWGKCESGCIVATIIRVIMITRNLQSTLSFNLKNDSEMVRSVDMN